VVRNLPSRFYATIESQVASSREDHPLLLAALREHDARKAKSVMERHILVGGDHLVEILERRGHWINQESAS